MSSSFFDEQSDASAVKAALVNKYVSAWAKVMLSQPHVNDIAFIDLFAGPGRYGSGKSSTPLLVVANALENSQMRSRLLTVFNDQDPEHVASLKNAIAAMPGIELLSHQPEFYNIEVTEEITRWFEESELPPSLVFFDPWGYKGLSLGLIDAALKVWGSDVIFFFNYNRINMGITNEAVADHIDALFGTERARELRTQVANLSPEARELYIVNAVGEALMARRAKFVIPFRFRTASGARTSHYLFFASKNVLGYKIMKEIMFGASAKSEDGVASFEYTPVEDQQLALLFAYSRRIDDLRRRLRATYSGQSVAMEQLFQNDNVGTPFVMRNYKDILIEMEAAGEVACDPPVENRKKIHGNPTMGDKVLIKFHE